MKRDSFGFLLLVLLIATTSITVRSQQPSFNVAGIKPFDKAVPGQVMEVLIEGLTSDASPVVLPATSFRVEVSQDGITQLAKVRITKFTMIREMNPESSNRNTVDFAGMKMRPYQSVSFVVPQGLHPGPAEVVASYKGQRGNAVAMEIIEKPLRPVVTTTAVLMVRLPKDLKGGNVKFTIENFGGDRYSTPVTKSFVLESR